LEIPQRGERELLLKAPTNDVRAVSSTDRAAYSAERSVLVELNIYLYLFVYLFTPSLRPYVYTVSVEWATVPASFALRRSAR